MRGLPDDVLESQFACCLGDTLASELGILSSSPPILITTLKTVPAGTNGGISVGGTIASGIGGCIVGLVQFASLVVENSVCRAEWTGLLPTLIGWGFAAGIFGSMVGARLLSATTTIVRSSDVAQLDSLLGATLQRTRYSTDNKRVLNDESVPDKDESIKVISGINVLTNNQVRAITVLCPFVECDVVPKVNLLSSVITALLVAALA